MLLGCWAGKSVCLARSGLTICHDANIVAVEEQREEWRECKIKDSILIGKILEDMIKMEPLVDSIPTTPRES